MRLAINGRFYAAAVTGVQRFAREVTRRLCERTEITLLLPGGAEPPPLPGSPRVLRGRLRGHAFEQLEAPALARRAGCNATLHLSGTLPLHGGPHIAVLHDVLPLTHPAWFSRRFGLWYRFVLRTGVRRAAALITVSEWSKQEITRTLGVAPSSVSVVLQGIGPFDGPADAAHVNAIRRRLQLPRRFVLALGAGDPRKNLAFLDSVMSAWRDRRGTALPLVIVGAALPRVHGRSPNGRATTAMRAADRVRLGRVSDEELHAIYTAASALCFPSLAEGFGRAPLEAAACGTPALVAPYPSVTEVLDGSALVVPLEPAQWADALHDLTSADRQTNGQLERAQPLLERMRWDDCADRVLEICTHAVLRSRRLGSPAAAAAGAQPREGA